LASCVSLWTQRKPTIKRREIHYNFLADATELIKILIPR
jgi:hypothetical protein